MTLNTKILAGFIACSIVLVIVASISFSNSEKFIETNRWVNHTHEVLEELDHVLLSTVNTETGARGFLITGEPSYLEPYNSGKQETVNHLRKSQELTADNPTQQANIEKIRSVIDTRMQTLADVVEKRRNNNLTLAETRELIISSKGKALQDEIRRLIDDAQSIERRLLAERISASEKESEDFKSLFVGLLCVIALVLVAMYVIIRLNLRALRKAQDESNRKNWMLTGSGDLVRVMQGNKLASELSQSIISNLVAYIDGLLGAIYVTGSDGRSLRLVASTAMTKEDEQHIIPFGEALVGRAASEKRAVIVKDIPKDFKLSSSFGSVPPANVIAIPFVFETSVIGVVEIGSLHPLSELDIEFLNFVADSIAIAIVSCLAREKTDQLLEETQRQAEELEVQQEELRQSNEELTVKTEMLQRSEMILKTQQEELKVANEELGQKADILENQKSLLEKAKAETEVKARQVEVTSKYKSEFLANMSHELRTPLNSILILAQLLSENKSGKLAQKDIEYARNIHTSGSDLLNLINDILDLSKVEAGKLQLEIDEVPLKRIIESMSAMFTELANSKGITFRIEVDNSVGNQVLKTDRHRVEQIIRNLLSNAFKFTSPSGDVILAISRAGERSMLAFSVRDTGIGIPEDKQKLVFEAFQQADGSTKRKFGGTGLGLSISRELAHALGGEITLTSQEGKGSTFTLYIPVIFDPSQSVAQNKEIELRDVTIEQPKSSAKTEAEAEDRQVSLPDSSDDRYSLRENDRVVLIIEDDEQFANVLLDLVRERHYKGIVAREGISGITAARHYKPDAIVLDLMLPIMSGSDVLKHLKNDPDLRHIPVQIISAMDQRKDVLDAGAFDYIQKPVSSTDLRKAFEKIENFSTKKVKRLLIVEDNEMQNLAIKELIGNGDVKCTSAFLGKEALKMLEDEKFDCMILDLGLPDISGFELLEKIKTSTSIQPLPIVVYTGKELKKEDAMKLNRLASTVVLKTANSHERLLDETILFLHRVESRLPKEKQNLIRKLHKADELLNGKKILIVDDDIRNIYSLTNALEDEGVISIVADNGKTAIEALQNDPSVDLVLMDIMMPEMDGYEATMEIRKDERFQRLPIIALTAKAMKGDKERCLAVGMSDYVSKPVDLTKLLSLMRVWLYR